MTVVSFLSVNEMHATRVVNEGVVDEAIMQAGQSMRRRDGWINYIPLRSELGARSLMESRVFAKTGLNDSPSIIVTKLS